MNGGHIESNHPDPRHGKKFTIMFTTTSGKIIRSCIFDSTRFASPSDQILHEHPVKNSTTITGQHDITENISKKRYRLHRALPRPRFVPIMIIPSISPN